VIVVGGSASLRKDLSREAAPMSLVFCSSATDLTRQGSADGIIGITDDPIDFTARVRRLTATPLLIAGGEAAQAASCLDLGANMWLPLSSPARLIVAAIRRAITSEMTPRSLERRLQLGELQLDIESRRAWSNAAELALAPREFDLLGVLMKNPGIALSRDRILAEAWGPRFVGEPKTVDVHVAWLRQKLDGCGVRVTTIRGLGYRLDVLAR
jgi:DNA-binding response OmpR family regulator